LSESPVLADLRLADRAPGAADRFGAKYTIHLLAKGERTVTMSLTFCAETVTNGWSDEPSAKD
jgi:hypothetical protein